MSVNLTIIGSEIGLPPNQHPAIIWNNAGLLSIGSIRTNLMELLSQHQKFH